MNRRAFLTGATVVLSLSAGCLGGGSGETESTATDNESTSQDPTFTTTKAPSGTASRTTIVDDETSEVATFTTTEGTPALVGDVPDICEETIFFSELSSASQEEFRMALDDGLIRDGYDEFQIYDELPGVDDEVGYETCVVYEGDPYYPLFGPLGRTDGGWKLTYQVAGDMRVTEDRTNTVTAPSDFETTSGTGEGTSTGSTCGSDGVGFYGLNASFADNVWGPSSVSVGFGLGAGKQVELVVLEDDMVLGTKRVEAPADTGFVSDGEIISLDTELSGEHTIQVVMYPATGEGDQVSPKQATPCQYEGQPVQTELRTIDFSRFSQNNTSTTQAE